MDFLLDLISPERKVFVLLNNLPRILTSYEMIMIGEIKKKYRNSKMTVGLVGSDIEEMNEYMIHREQISHCRYVDSVIEMKVPFDANMYDVFVSVREVRKNKIHLYSPLFNIALEKIEEYQFEDATNLTEKKRIVIEKIQEEHVNENRNLHQKLESLTVEKNELEKRLLDLKNRHVGIIENVRSNQKAKEETDGKRLSEVTNSIVNSLDHDISEIIGEVKNDTMDIQNLIERNHKSVKIERVHGYYNSISNIRSIKLIRKLENSNSQLIELELENETTRNKKYKIKVLEQVIKEQGKLLLRTEGLNFNQKREYVSGNYLYICVREMKCCDECEYFKRHLEDSKRMYKQMLEYRRNTV